MDWNAVLSFARGPFFQVSLLIFIVGMSYRLFRIVFLGWSRDRVKPRGSKFGGVVKSYLKGLLILPFFPWVKNTFNRNPLIYIAGGLFHLALFVVVFLGTAHMLVWKDLLGFGWFTLKTPLVDLLAAIGIISLIMLLINRIVNPVVKMISGPAEYISWVLVFLPFITGYMMYHHIGSPYEKTFALHVLTVDVLLIWIPLSRISHFMFYFFSRTIHGVEFGKRAVSP
jgi:nitrate reductase gamma subunit